MFCVITRQLSVRLPTCLNRALSQASRSGASIYNRDQAGCYSDWLWVLNYERIRPWNQYKNRFAGLSQASLFNSNLVQTSWLTSGHGTSYRIILILRSPHSPFTPLGEIIVYGIVYFANNYLNGRGGFFASGTLAPTRLDRNLTDSESSV